MSFEISVQAFHQIENQAYVLDVREGWELKKAQLKTFVHCPLSEIYRRKDELPSDRPIYVLCHHGVEG